MTEKFANNAIAKLSADIDSFSESLLVTDASKFPTSGNFRIKIEDELLLVTAVSGTSFTVTRGVEGTTAASHVAGTTLAHVLTVASFIEAIEQEAGIGDPVLGGTAGSVLFLDGSANLAQDNANLYWDDTNNRLGIGTQSDGGSGARLNIGHAVASYALRVANGTVQTGIYQDNVAGWVTTISNHPLQFSTNQGAAHLKIDTTGAVIVNEGGGATDFRVEGETQPNLLFVQGSTDRIGLNTATPTAGYLLTVNGAVDISNKAQFDGDSTAGNTRFLLYDVDSASLKRVKVGASGTGPGGSGRALYID